MADGQGFEPWVLVYLAVYYGDFLKNGLNCYRYRYLAIFLSLFARAIGKDRIRHKLDDTQERRLIVRLTSPRESTEVDPEIRAKG
jgi:hypothetical protein